MKHPTFQHCYPAVSIHDDHVQLKGVVLDERIPLSDIQFVARVIPASLLLCTTTRTSIHLQFQEEGLAERDTLYALLQSHCNANL